MVDIECLICYEVIDGEERYGYPGCFDNHTFCKDCIAEMVKTKAGKECPIDKKENNKIILRKNDEEFILDEYYQLFIGHDIGEPIDHRINEHRSTGKYPLNICLYCKNVMSDDTDMFWWQGCPEHHRVCAYCLGDFDDDDDDACFMGHSECNTNEDNGDDDKQYYCSRLSNTGTKILVSIAYICTFRFLKKKINKSITNSEDETPITPRIDYVERIEGVLKVLRDTGKCPGDICSQCLNSIQGPSYGFKECYKYHIFCEECVLLIVQPGLACPACYNSTDIIYIIEDGNVIYEMNARKLKLREYLRNMEVRNERAQQILTNMERSPNCDAFIPPEICIGCFTVIRGRRHNVGDDFNYCKQCIIEISANKQTCIYVNPKIFYWQTKKELIRLHFHYYSIIDFINSNGRTEESKRSVKTDLRKYFNCDQKINCVKCGEGDFERSFGGYCYCYEVCCDACLEGIDWETTCPFSPRITKID